jgi:signal transduction histidine kinase
VTDGVHGETDEARALRESELNFRHMAENVPGALFQYIQFDDGRSQVTYMSPRCLELWEVPAEQIESDASILWQMVHPDDLPGMAASVAQSARDMSPWYHEWRITTPSGRQKWLQGSGRPVARDAESVKWNSFILDVSERRNAELAADRLKEQLQRAEQLEALGRLAGGVAHDVNNVLTVILGFAESAHDMMPDGSAARDDIAEVISAASRAASLTRQLLAFARRQPSEATVFDPAERLEESSLMLHRLIDGRVALDYVLDPKVPTLSMDPAQFDQVVTNLVLNARDATPDGGQVQVSLTRVDNWVELAVADEGAGMDADTQARIFEPLFSTKPASQGTGLGLSTVRGIVIAAGGTLDVESHPGTGSTFRVRLPVSGASPATRDAPSAPTGRALPRSVLLCEDDAALRRVVERVLRRHGIEVRSAHEPGAALALVSDWTPELLVTDVVMGGGGGVWLADALRERVPGIPVLFITGYVDNDLARKALESGGDTVLRKPFRNDALLDALEQAWDRVTPRT